MLEQDDSDGFANLVFADAGDDQMTSSSPRRGSNRDCSPDSNSPRARAAAVAGSKRHLGRPPCLSPSVVAPGCGAPRHLHGRFLSRSFSQSSMIWSSDASTRKLPRKTTIILLV